ncbi:MAG TPA: LemA family protein [Sumerlaeia bacterium]|nr:LemA family protein [Sumerlaeia bacterium]
MRSELKEAVRRLHSEDYQRLQATEKRVKRSKRLEVLRPLAVWAGPSGGRRSRLRSAVLATVGLIVLTCVIAAGVYYYNMFSFILVDMDKTRSLVDNEIERRANLIPNLLVVSAEYSTHEKALYKHVSEMRSQLANHKGNSSAETSLTMRNLMSSLLAVAEQYPDLKATQSFEQLMRDWTETENRIAEARAAYIKTIRDYNALCTTFPSNVFGLLFGRGKCDPFSFEEASTTLADVMGFYSSYPAKGLSGIPGAGDAEAPQKVGENASTPSAEEGAEPDGALADAGNAAGTGTKVATNDEAAPKPEGARDERNKQ